MQEPGHAESRGHLHTFLRLPLCLIEKRGGWLVGRVEGEKKIGGIVWENVGK